MAKTGPQKYPGASTTYWFGNRYSGASMEINACVWHTTEGTTVPTYGGGASAPTLTALPDFAAKKLRWYQHFDLEQSARALVDAAGGITTNRNNLCQIELVGTCDPATHRKWQAAGRQHIFWPQAPDWALAEVAKFVRWLYDNHRVPLSSSVTWRPYPASYGTGAAQRLSSAAFNQYTGHLGHQHVPEGNDHGDPGDLDFARILQLARAGTTTTAPAPTAPKPAEETDVPSVLNEPNPVDVVLDSGKWVALAFADGIIHTGPRRHDTLVHLLFDEDTPQDAVIEGRFYLTDTAGKDPSAYLPVKKQGGGGHQFVLAGQVPSGRQLRFEVRATTKDDSPIKLLHRVASGLHWAG
jgi:hypothetical protein